jgi:NADH-quinone oxidoreductase subunit J
MVLFLFVIMLLGVDREVPLTERIRGQRWMALLLGAGLAAEVAVAVWAGMGFSRGDLPDFSAVNEGGNVRALARLLFNRYFFPFEVTSVLLIVAAIGAMLHGRRGIGEEEIEDREPLTSAGARTAEPGGAGP